MHVAIDIAGWLGMMLLVGAYALLTARRVRGTGWVYQSMNLAGGLGLLANTAYYQAWPSAALNLVWFGIGLVGLIHSGASIRRAAHNAQTKACAPGVAGSLVKPSRS